MTFDLTITLLARMGKNLKYDFDEDFLKRNVYQPIAHAQVEEEQNELRMLALRLLKDQGRLPIAVFPDTFSQQVLPPLKDKPDS